MATKIQAVRKSKRGGKRSPRPARKADRIKEELNRWQAIVQPLVDEVNQCERLSKDDYAIRINARD